MALELFPNLPGTRVSTSFDFQKAVSTSRQNTEAVLLLGVATDGPTKEVFRLPSIPDGLTAYGDLTSVTKASDRTMLLAKGIREASEAGCNDIYCLRISGIPAELSPAYTGANLTLKALYGGVKYGNAIGTAGIGVLITENAVNILDINGNAYAIPFTSGVTTYQQLIEAINSNGLYYKVKAESRGDSDPTTVITSHSPAVISGSVSGPFAITPSSNDTLKFTSVDGDNNSASGWTITFPGTKGSVVNASSRASGYFVLRGVNDTISLSSNFMDTGVYEDLCVLLDGEDSKHFTGAELATRLQTVINASSALTDGGSITVTVTYTAPTSAKFSIAVPVAEPQVNKVAIDYGRSTIASTLGYDASIALAQKVDTTVKVDYNVVQNGNDRMSLGENGQYIRDIVVASGSYEIGALVTAINTAIDAVGSDIVCSSGSAGLVTFTSGRFGSSSSVTVSAGTTDFRPTIGYDGVLTTTAGTGFAAFLDAATAQEVADRITTASNNVNAMAYYNTDGGLAVKIYSSVRGTSGSLVTAASSTSTINATLGITQSTTYTGTAGNLPVTLPLSTDTSWKVKYMSGGDDQLTLTNDQLLDALAEVYAVFEEYEGPNIVVPLGVRIFTDSFGALDTRHASNLARFCTNRTNLGNYTHGIMCLEPIRNTNQASINARATAHAGYDFAVNYKDDYCISTSTPADTLMLQNGVMAAYNIRAMLSIISGPEGVFYQNSIGSYVGTMEAAYAGRNVSLPLKQSSTNQRITGPVGLYYRYGKGQLNDITGARFVTFNQDQDGAIKTVIDVTYDQAGATYNNYMTFRIAATVVNNLQQVFKPYYGRAMSLTDLNSLGSAIQVYLDGIKMTGYIDNFSYEITNAGQAKTFSELFVKVSLITPGELKRINLALKLTDKIA